MFGKCCSVIVGSAAILVGAALGGDLPSTWVDPSIGTAATGHAFPGPCRPFGLVQPSPDTGNGSWKYCSGYAWTDTSVRRFSQTHVSGTGQAGLGDVGILPFVGDIPDPQTASAPFAKSTERIELGYYGVTLESGIKVEIAAGRRLARYRISFPTGSRGGVLLDFLWGLYRQKEYLPHLTTTCEVSRVSARRWVGSNHSDVWAPRDIHYVVEFNRAPDDVIDLPCSAKGLQAAAIFSDGGVVEMAISISANSQAGALRNFDAECGCDFDRLVQETCAEWDRILLRIRWDQVAPEERKSVATSVYHLCVQPNEISDIGEPVRYSTFSLWDTFRDAHPLYEKLVPEQVPGFVNSLLAHYDRWGYLPQWELWGRETGGMIGSHAVPVIVDAVEHGFGGFDKAKAYRAVRDTLRKSERPGMGVTYPRRTDWEVLDRYGYYPYDVIKRESVSRTLECCYDDACAARFAKAMGKDEDAAFFERRSWAFTNLFDVATCCFRPKDSKGHWLEDFNPAGLSPHFTEGSALQWSWYVLHRPEWLVGAMGGKDAFEKRLDAFFAGSLLPGADRGNSQDITGLVGDYAHGNEPCHHVIGLYRLVGRDDKSIALEKRICGEFYRPTPDGLCGNDDCGQMSAWYLRRRCGGTQWGYSPSHATRVMCLGDSITHFGYCEYYLQLFENLRHPGSAVRYVNAGYSGGTVGTGLNRLPLETDRIRPDRAFVMFGMNDVRWTDYATNAVMSAERRRAADKALATYRADLPKLVDRILASGVRDLTLVTPTPYDEYSTALGPRRKFVNEYGLSLAAESVRRLAAEKGLKVVDLHAALTDACRTNPGKKLCGGDSVHPGKIGHLLMASVYWRTLGCDSPVAAVTLDASGNVIRVENAEVSGVSATTDALSFGYTPGALPFPDCPEYREVKAINPDFARFNREPLVVVGLKAGDWELLVDGRRIGTFSADVLSRGVNLAELDTPNRRQAAMAMEAAYKLHDFDVLRRNVACVRSSFEKFGVDMNDRDALAKRSEERLAKLKAEKYRWYDWEKAASEKFLESVGREAEIAAEEDRLYAAIAAPRPVTCRVEIRRTVKLSASGESTLTVYLPKGIDITAAVVICPGGGYRELCDTYEGVEMAKWLTARGIAAFVLRYRLSPRWHKDAMLADVRSALACVRRRAVEWRIDPRKVGVLGFSAGGHLACMAGTATESPRPDFMALVYPHVSMARGLGSEHMRTAFLGPDYRDPEINAYSGENRVTRDTPRTFLVHARTDEICPVEHSRRFAAAMRAKGRPIEYLELESGRHGLGCGKGELWTAWLSAFGKWLDLPD